MSDNAAATGPPRLDKAEGALLALAAGDALGWPQEMPRNIQGDLRPQAQLEFRQWTRRSGGRFQPYEEPIHPGDYSDDTPAHARSRTLPDEVRYVLVESADKNRNPSLDPL